MGGVLIAGMGLPGSGKSSVFAALADSFLRKSRTTVLYREPEEAHWPDAVRSRDRCGCITAMTWFRSARVPMLYHAASDREEGKIAIVDSYYDKLIHLYFDAPSFAWLIPFDDPYRAIYREFARLDFEKLPDADCVVSFAVDEERWRELVLGRGRELDRKSRILDMYQMQEPMLNASSEYCEAKGIPHVVFRNVQSTTAGAADVLARELMKIGIVPGEEQ
jgi:hypothetical protein